MLIDDRDPGIQQRYRRYLLLILMLSFGFIFAERLAMGLLLQDIKADLDLTDTQLGLITGLAFAFFYSAMSLPIARWADRGNRVVVIALGAIVSGSAVIFCGTATGFAHLLVIRAWVAVGEAACIPPAHSLLADHFDRAERPRASALYKLGGSLSLVIGYIATGWVNAHYGWRTTFTVLGAPSIFLGILAWLTLREPRSKPGRTLADGKSARIADGAPPVPKAQSLLSALTALWHIPTYRNLLLAFAVAGFFNTGIGQWEPSYFIRSFGMSSQDLGLWFGLCVGVGGAVGTLLGGELASRFAARNEQLQLRAISVCYATLCILFGLKYLAPNAELALALTFMTALGGGLTLGPLFGIIQTIVPPQIRATSVAILYLFGNLLGLGLGPLAVGALSDLFEPEFASESLRWALICFAPGLLWCSIQIWLAGRTIEEDVQDGSAAGAAA